MKLNPDKSFILDMNLLMTHQRIGVIQWLSKVYNYEIPCDLEPCRYVVYFGDFGYFLCTSSDRDFLDFPKIFARVKTTEKKVYRSDLKKWDVIKFSYGLAIVTNESTNARHPICVYKDRDIVIHKATNFTVLEYEVEFGL